MWGRVCIGGGYGSKEMCFFLCLPALTETGRQDTYNRV